MIGPLNCAEAKAEFRKSFAVPERIYQGRQLDQFNRY